MRLLGIIELVKGPLKRIKGELASYSPLWYEVRYGVIYVRGENRAVDKETR